MKFNYHNKLTRAHGAEGEVSGKKFWMFVRRQTDTSVAG